MHFLLQQDCGSVVSSTWCGMVTVAVLPGVRGEVTVHFLGWGGGGVVGWGFGKRGDTSYTA